MVALRLSSTEGVTAIVTSAAAVFFVHRVVFSQVITYFVVLLGDTHNVSIQFNSPVHPSEAVQLSALDIFQLRVLLSHVLMLVPPVVTPNAIVGVCGVITSIFTFSIRRIPSFPSQVRV